MTNSVKPVAASGATPAPTPAPKHHVTDRFGLVSSGYGTNKGQNPSSINPGQTCTSDLADSLKAAGTDGKLDALISGGLRGGAAVANPDRKLGDKPAPPVTFGMKNPNK